MIMMKPSNSQLQCFPRGRKSIYNLSLPDIPFKYKKKPKHNNVRLQGKFKTRKDAGPARCRDMEENVNMTEQQLEGCFREPA